MNHKKFFEELMRALSKLNGVEFKNAGQQINVKLDDGRDFVIRKSGGITFERTFGFDDRLRNLYCDIVEITNNVKEYLQAMETSPPLQAKDFTMPYKKLAEFNGVVLGGIEHENGTGYEFTTWEYSYDGEHLYQGHYHTDYAEAKEDFVVRSGLLPESKLFSEQELREISGCVSERLNGCSKLTDTQQGILDALQEKLSRYADGSNQPEQEQGMDMNGLSP